MGNMVLRTHPDYASEQPERYVRQQTFIGIQILIVRAASTRQK
jgi:hypothetical protein